MLPNSRNTTYGPASPVESADLDDIQDCIVGSKRKSTPRTFFPTLLDGPNWTKVFGAGTSYYVAAGGVLTAWFSVPVDEGDRVTDLLINAYGDGAVDATIAAWYFDAAQVGHLIATVTDLDRAAAWGFVSLAADIVTPWANHTFVAGESLMIGVSPTGANYRLGNCKLIYDRL